MLYLFTATIMGNFSDDETLLALEDSLLAHQSDASEQQLASNKDIESSGLPGM